MELRHLRYFIAIAEELHFGRAAERLHIEQSPLSRAIRQLEDELGVKLLERNVRGTRLTRAGAAFLQDSRRVFLCFQQAQDNARAVARGCRGVLRVALSEGLARHHLTNLLARCREEEPEVEVHLFQVPSSMLLKGLQDDLFDAGFSYSADVGERLWAEPLWSDPLFIILPTRHPLLRYQAIPSAEFLNYPLVLCMTETGQACCPQLDDLLRSLKARPDIIGRVTSHELMVTLVAAGYGIGFSSAAHIEACRYPDIVARPIADGSFELATYLLRPEQPPSAQLSNFIQRARQLYEL